MLKMINTKNISHEDKLQIKKILSDNVSSILYN